MVVCAGVTCGAVWAMAAVGERNNDMCWFLATRKHGEGTMKRLASWQTTHGNGEAGCRFVAVTWATMDAGKAMTWATVDVCGHFKKLNGRGCSNDNNCQHCGSVVQRSQMKYHLAACKSLPGSVRAVMDHAAVCESRAGLGCYGGVHASVYRGFRVTGWGVNECRRCGEGDSRLGSTSEEA